MKRKLKVRARGAAGVLALALLTGGAAFAAPVPDGALARMARDAEVIFLGTVGRVQYRMSDPVDSVPSLPHTFVTFWVDEVFKGEVRNDDFTLRFLGGLPDPGTFVRFSGIPLFDTGERMLVFARGNGELDNPIVGETRGLLRVIDGFVYTFDGRPVSPAGAAALRVGARREFDEVDVHAVVGTPLVMRVRRPTEVAPGDEDGFDFSEPRGPAALRAQLPPASESTFMAWIGSLVRRVHDPAELHRPVQDARPDQRFVGPDLRSGSARSTEEDDR